MAPSGLDYPGEVSLDAIIKEVIRNGYDTEQGDSERSPEGAGAEGEYSEKGSGRRGGEASEES